jgi:hypothetical protein
MKWRKAKRMHTKKKKKKKRYDKMNYINNKKMNYIGKRNSPRYVTSSHATPRHATITQH